mmetsp:Transcript_17092/g.42048  ORF Transcript_17092/g.42048 Transcript_17092/m.42048 type:complete len:229 (-) Transcript_17092:397-1083(-)
MLILLLFLLLLSLLLLLLLLLLLILLLLMLFFHLSRPLDRLQTLDANASALAAAAVARLRTPHHARHEAVPHPHGEHVRKQRVVQEVGGARRREVDQREVHRHLRLGLRQAPHGGAHPPLVANPHGELVVVLRVPQHRGQQVRQVGGQRVPPDAARLAVERVEAVARRKAGHAGHRELARAAGVLGVRRQVPRVRREVPVPDPHAQRRHRRHVVVQLLPAHEPNVPPR